MGGTKSFVNQIIDYDWNMDKVDFSRVGTDALISGIKGVLSFVSGAWTGGAGLWNIPNGAAPGALNFITKVSLNAIIGSGWKLSVDVIYAMVMEEECGWVNALKKIMEMIF